VRGDPSPRVMCRKHASRRARLPRTGCPGALARPRRSRNRVSTVQFESANGSSLPRLRERTVAPARRGGGPSPFIRPDGAQLCWRRIHRRSEDGLPNCFGGLTGNFAELAHPEGSEREQDACQPGHVVLERITVSLRWSHQRPTTSPSPKASNLQPLARSEQWLDGQRPSTSYEICKPTFPPVAMTTPAPPPAPHASA
jgi:hypothetical protein